MPSLTTQNYTDPDSGSPIAFIADGSGNLTQSVYLCDPSDPTTPITTFPVTGTFWQATQPISIAAGASSIAKAEDAASADADLGVPAMAIRKATPANTSGTDGDYEMLQVSAGRLWCSATIDAALPAGTSGTQAAIPSMLACLGCGKGNVAAVLDNTNMSALGEFRIKTGTTDTSDPTNSAVDQASVYIALKEAVTGGGG